MNHITSLSVREVAKDKINELKLFRMIKRGLYLNFLALIVTIFAFIGCENRGPEYISDYDVVYTNYDTGKQFSEVQTYQLPDTVIYLVPKEDQEDIDHKYDEFLLTAIKENLDALGWQQIPKDQEGTVDADLFITVSALRTTWINQYWYEDWWFWWGNYSGFYPGWGWGSGYYPWYGFPVYYTTYDTGTVFIEMLDPTKNTEEEGQISSVWVGVVNGLLEGSNIKGRIESNIDQAFTQSPYLKSTIQ
ncbi:DUF4136 domain-containing protein [Prolixibacteraceae bacterium]|nr:DUF4136 domain-containing protein [Prolixibacteraceae bacterium]